MSRMKWSNLKSLKCPECGKPLGDKTNKKGPYGYYKVRECTNCSFLITENKFNEVVNGLYFPRKKKPAEVDMDFDRNLRGLSEL